MKIVKGSHEVGFVLNSSLKWNNEGLIIFSFLFRMSFCRSLKLVLIDLSGTLHIENEITPNAVEALQR